MKRDRTDGKRSKITKTLAALAMAGGTVTVGGTNYTIIEMLGVGNGKVVVRNNPTYSAGNRLTIPAIIVIFSTIADNGTNATVSISGSALSRRVPLESVDLGGLGNRL